MNVAASRVVVESFLQGCFDVFDALFTLSFGAVADMFDAADIQGLTADALGEQLAQYPVVMRTGLKRGGVVAMLVGIEDAGRFAALATGEEAAPKATLDDADLATLTEVASSCLGGGVSNLMDTLGQGPEQLEDVETTVGDGTADAVMAMLGEGAVMAPFQFAAPPALDGSGVLLFSGNLEEMVPKDLIAGPGASADGDALAADARLSEAEMSDILSGFSPGAGDDLPVMSEAATQGAAPAVEPPNLDMVLDIKLVATARLGRVNMPIGDILALGPGSIIEVGHLVDEPIELLVNEKLIARGDVVVIDEKFGLRITEIVSPQERIESLR